ncbi:hypothetical protein [Glycomyces algeriensis]|uniref:Uncharacterized protein n=1 Tax=Glycomyces algeriensis TaxID=256037 RepID=A0A9W6G9A5_9ACTN|nr:hypothetical protein [Glycomyces algeriensis]MDA1367359.1 hypothetical protein [Glycomyces algeriensis]MDR7350987.1 hypothetical protein [Glycomyces algeriensis]GLI43699.1 hypothetical protein GALLR39Z86_35490 [Glycomyces algeriensis]
MTRHNINIDDDVWRIAAASGNASAYIEQAVKDRYLHELENAAGVIVAALPQSEIDDWRAWGTSIADDATGGQR